MMLRDKRGTDGRRLDEKLDELVGALVEQFGQTSDSAELYLHLRDLHDGAVRLERCIEQLANCSREDLPTLNTLLWEIRAETFDHLMPNHLEQLRIPLFNICSAVAERALARES